MTRIDSHTHTVYSGHGEGSVEEVAQAAERLGISSLALTEHLTLPIEIDPEREVSMSDGEALRYRDDIARARELHPAMQILCGVEIDWLGHVDRQMLEKARDYEYVLGSVHYIDGWAHDDPNLVDQWADHDVDEAWRRYFEIWCEVVRSPYPFDCMSHPDLVKKFGFRPSFDPRELYHEAARVAAAHDVMVEVNTSGLRHPVHELYPCEELLRAFREEGVDCTIGSDAHTPSLVGFGYDEACEALVRVGYTRITVPCRDGDRSYIALER